MYTITQIDDNGYCVKGENEEVHGFIDTWEGRYIAFNVKMQVWGDTKEEAAEKLMEHTKGWAE